AGAGMAAGLSRDAVLLYLQSRGGSVRNAELLQRFRGYIREDPDRDRNRELFKRFVNSLATVQQVDGVSYVVLRKKFRGGPGPPAGPGQPPSRDPRGPGPPAGPGQPPSRDPRGPGPPAGPGQPPSRDPRGPGPPAGPAGGQPFGGVGKAPPPPSTASPAPSSPSSSSSESLCFQPPPSGIPESRSSSRGASCARRAAPPTISTWTRSPPCGPGAPPQKTAGGARGEGAGRSRSPAAGAKAHDEDHARQSLVPLEAREHAWLVKGAAGAWPDIYSLFREDSSLLNRKDFISGFTVLHWIAKHGDHRVLNTLWYGVEKAGLTFDVNARSTSGHTPLHIAAIHGHKNIIRLLVRKFNADVRLRDTAGKKAWHYL
uniref:SOWAHA-C winged helix-turn-helix domain-containing protein n=1 Tax=Tetraodon nigroviridis TaxID=99883 RepID=H3CBT3_TETNG